MNSIIKNILAILGGILVGMLANMGLIVTGNKLIPLSESMNPMNAMNWEIQHFIFPFLAHANGTLAGAFIASKFSESYHMLFAMSIGIFFLSGGIYMVFILPAPIWFIVIDLVFAYLPMGWLGWKISKKELN